MKKSTLAITAAILIALGAAGYMVIANRNDKKDPDADTYQEQTGTPPAGSRADSDQTAQTNKVEIANFSFQPASISVKKGTTVTWTNRDSAQHSVIPDDGDSEAFKGSSLLAKDASYSFTFNTPGTYAYHCGPHPQMTGTITVTE